MIDLIPRASRMAVLDALSDTRIVMVLGARQVGKSTLAEEIVEKEHPAVVINLDDRAPREAALSDPEGFIAGLTGPVLIDEAQRGGPDLLLAIKAAVDRDKAPGRFLLTGSANLLANRRTYDALTGRIEAIRLWPLAQAEITRSPSNFVDALFAGQPPQVANAPVGRGAFSSRLSAGGYPEARERPASRRDRWFSGYLETTLGRDLRDISDAYKIEILPRLLRSLAARAANLITYRDLASGLGIDPKTVQQYTRLLELVYLVRTIPAWKPGIASREVGAPKILIADSGLHLHLLGADEGRLTSDDQVTGRAFENFVGMEIIKQMEWAQTGSRAYHYRQRNDEVDLVLESRSGEVVCIEAKAAVSLRSQDWRALERTRDRLGEKFVAGVIVHTGEQTVPLGDRLWAVPVSGLWSG